MRRQLKDVAPEALDKAQELRVHALDDLLNDLEGT
jgi:hypothetical protein